MPKQTGPKTPEGKAKSSLNALKHGLTSNRMFVLANETQEIWDKILKVWTDRLKPADDAELLIVIDIAHATWRIRRARTVETGMLDLEMDAQFEKMAAMFVPPVDEVSRLASAFKGLADNSDGLNQLHRYETRARRAFKAGMNALEQLRRMSEPSAPAAGAPQPEWGGTPVPRPVSRPAQGTPRPPAQQPAAQQLPPDPEKLQNEIRRDRIRRVRIAFGNRVPIRLIPPKRRKCR